MNAISKRLLSWLCVIAMVLSFVPVMDLSNLAVATQAADVTGSEASDTTETTEATEPKKDYGSNNWGASPLGEDGVQAELDKATTIQNAAAVFALDAEGKAVCPACGGAAVQWTKVETTTDDGNTIAGALATETGSHLHLYFEGEVDVTSMKAYYLAWIRPDKVKVKNGAQVKDEEGNLVYEYRAANDSSICILLKDAQVTTNGMIRAGAANGVINVMGTGSITSDGADSDDLGLFLIQGSNNTLNLYGGTFVYTGDANGSKVASTTLYTASEWEANYGAVAVKGEGNKLNMYPGVVVGPELGTDGEVVDDKPVYNVRVMGNGTFNMYGGTIQNGVTAFAQYDGDYDNYYLTGNLYLNGSGVTGNIYDGQILNGTFVPASALPQSYVYKNGVQQFEEDGTTPQMQDTTIANWGGNVVVFESASLNMYGGTVSGGKANNGGNGGGNMSILGTANLMGGKVLDGYAKARGGNIQFSAGSATIGGTFLVRNGLAHANGGNISVNISNLIINDGWIDQGRAAKGGGNIDINSGNKKVTVNGGIISNGWVMGTSTSGTYRVSGGTWGSNIRAWGAKVTINGGLIYGGVRGVMKDMWHSADNIGCMSSVDSSSTANVPDAELIITGGTIVGDINTSKPTTVTRTISGVEKTFTSNGTSIQISGNPKILKTYEVDGEKYYATSNGLNIPSGLEDITISDLEEGADICISGSSNQVLVASGFNADWAKYFNTYSSSQAISVSEAGELKIVAGSTTAEERIANAELANYKASKILNTDEYIQEHIDAKTCPMCRRTGVVWYKGSTATWNISTAYTTSTETADLKTARYQHRYYDTTIGENGKANIGGNIVGLFSDAKDYQVCVALFEGVELNSNTTSGRPVMLGTSNTVNIMGSGAMTAPSSNADGAAVNLGVFQASAGTLNLYGGKYYTADGQTKAVLRAMGATVNIYNDTVIGRDTVDESVAKYNLVVSGGTVNMYGGTIKNGVTADVKRSGNVTVAAGRTFNMYGGTITGGTYQQGEGITSPASYGGNVLVGGLNDGTTEGTGIFNMYGGTISDGEAIYGGNVAAYQEGSQINIYAGTITQGTAGVAAGTIDNVAVDAVFEAAEHDLNVAGTYTAADTKGVAGQGGNIWSACPLTISGGLIEKGAAYAPVTNTRKTVVTAATDTAEATETTTYTLSYPSDPMGQGGNIYASDLTVSGGTIEYGDAERSGGNVYIAEAGTMLMSAGTIQHGETKNAVKKYNDGGGNIFTNAAALTLQGGKILYGNTNLTNSAPAGGGLFFNGGSFTMTDGEIAYGKTNSDTAGGNVYATEMVTVNISGGSIHDGENTRAGGGNLGLFRCKATISGGEIYNGTSGSTGGNIFSTGGSKSAELHITGGEIYNGTAGTDGGNIAITTYKTGTEVRNLAVAEITGGKIYDGAAGAKDGQDGYGGNIFVAGHGTLSTSAGNAPRVTISNAEFYYTEEFAGVRPLYGGNLAVRYYATVTLDSGAKLYNGVAGENVVNNPYTQAELEAMDAWNTTGKTVGISGYGGNIYVSGAFLTVNEGAEIKDGFASVKTKTYKNSKGAVAYTFTGGEGGNIYMNGAASDVTIAGTCVGGEAFNGGNVQIINGELSITGTLDSGHAYIAKGDHGGGNLNITGGKVNTSGKIINGKSDLNGGNIHVKNTDAKLTISGGEIKDGDAGNQGGNIRTYNTTVTMTGGTVSGGTAKNVTTKSVWLVTANLNMSGGTIIAANENVGTAIACSSASFPAKITLSGDAKIIGCAQALTLSTGGTLQLDNSWNGIAYVTSSTDDTYGGKLTATNIVCGTVSEGTFTPGGIITENPGLYYGADAIGVIAQDGELYLGSVPTVTGKDEDGNEITTWYPSLDDAITSSAQTGDTVKIDNANTDTVTIPKDTAVIVDVNSTNTQVNINKAAEEGTHKVYLVDSSNDNYTRENCKKIVVESGVEVAPQAVTKDGKRYVARQVAENTYEVHRFDLKLSTVTLRLYQEDEETDEVTYRPGIYYKSEFAMDEKLKGSVDTFGIGANLGSMPKPDNADYFGGENAYTQIQITEANKETAFAKVTGKDNTYRMNSGMITDIINETRDSSDVSVYANMYVNVGTNDSGDDNAFLLSDPNAVTEAAKGYSLMRILVYINEHWSDYNADQQKLISDNVAIWNDLTKTETNLNGRFAGLTNILPPAQAAS